MTFNIEVVLKGTDYAVTEQASIVHGAPSSWSDDAVRDVLVETLRAISRAQNPDGAADRRIALRGFSWIVEPAEKEQVVIAIEIPMGAAIAGPFAIGQAELDTMISRVLRAERTPTSPTVH